MINRMVKCISQEGVLRVRTDVNDYQQALVMSKQRKEGLYNGNKIQFYADKVSNK